MSKMLFDYLIVGLDKLQRQNNRYYPYPPELILGMNELANRSGSDYPKTFDALLTLLEAPLGEWIPDTDLPAPLIPEAPLLYRKQLDDIAIQYLEDHGLEAVGAFTDIQSTRENQLMIDLIRQARQDYANAATAGDMMTIEKHYAEARYFLVQNSITSWQKLKQSLRNNRYREQILAMYDRIDDAHYLAYEDGKLLTCRECGPIQQTASGTQDSLKPSACSGRCPTRTGWDRKSLNPNMFVLKREIHKRTMIPGKAEIDLYRELLDLMEAQDEMILNQLRLYPAVDQYDLQLRFEYRNKNGDLQEDVWAVDVKDYHIPEVLGNEVKPQLDAGIHEAFPAFLPNLAWHRAFYIVPEYRETARDGYCETIRVRCGSDRFRNLDILTDNDFIQLVKRMIWRHSNV